MNNHPVYEGASSAAKEKHLFLPAFALLAVLVVAHQAIGHIENERDLARLTSEDPQFVAAQLNIADVPKAQRLPGDRIAAVYKGIDFACELDGRGDYASCTPMP